MALKLDLKRARHRRALFLLRLLVVTPGQGTKGYSLTGTLNQVWEPQRYVWEDNQQDNRRSYHPHERRYANVHICRGANFLRRTYIKLPIPRTIVLISLIRLYQKANLSDI